ncbi:MAG: hypothetical protein IT449_04455 [Phycisphaerales bacterium]|nr:hypothetical protein [Phycisphaerales bacterium]
MPRWAIGVAVALATLILADCVAGWLLIRDHRFRGRPAPPYNLTFNDAQRRHLAEMDEHWDPYTQFDPVLGWSIRPLGVSADGRFRANAAGLRADREYAPVPPEGKIRVAAFGDSFTHGATTNSDTWCAQLEALDDRLEVMNFGVNGYGPDQALLRYQTGGGAAARPRIVLIGLMVENILRSVSVYRPAYYHETNSAVAKPRCRIGEDGDLEWVRLTARDPRELKQEVETGVMLENLRRTDYWVQRLPRAYEGSALYGSSLMRMLDSVRENSGREPCEYYLDAQSEPYRVSRAILKRFAEDARRNGSGRVVVLFFPDESTLYSVSAGQAPCWSEFLRDLGGEGLEVLDLTDVLLQAFRLMGPRALFADNHYSARGNAIVAEAVHRRLFP